MRRIEGEVSNFLDKQVFSESDGPARHTHSNDLEAIQINDLLEWVISALVGSVADTLFDGNGSTILSIVVSFIYQFGILPIARPYLLIQIIFFKSLVVAALKNLCR